MITPYPHTFSGEQAVQEKEEFESFLGFVSEKNIKSYLEIGVARGDTFHEIVGEIPVGATAVAIDYPEKSWGLTQSQMMLKAAIKDLKKTGYDVRVIWGDSRYKGVIENASKDGPFDLIFIDGDHTYEGVKADFENYSPMGKLIAFHDIANDMKRNSKGELIEVPVFWNELKQEYKHWEFIVKGSNMGIGIIECSPAT